MQPAWRIESDGALSRNNPAQETWTSLKKGGSAGLYVVVMALSWWIAGLKEGSDESRAWKIVDDVTWVFSSALPTAPPAILEPTSVKRTSLDTDTDEARPLK